MATSPTNQTERMSEEPSEKTKDVVETTEEQKEETRAEDQTENDTLETSKDTNEDTTEEVATVTQTEKPPSTNGETTETINIAKPDTTTEPTTAEAGQGSSNEINSSKETNHTSSNNPPAATQSMVTIFPSTAQRQTMPHSVGQGVKTEGYPTREAPSGLPDQHQRGLPPSRMPYDDRYAGYPPMRQEQPHGHHPPHPSRHPPPHHQRMPPQPPGDYQDTGEDLIHCRISKTFEGHGMFAGRVERYFPSTRLFQVVYSDGDSEELTREQVTALLMDPPGNKANVPPRSIPEQPLAHRPDQGNVPPRYAEYDRAPPGHPAQGHPAQGHPAQGHVPPPREPPSSGDPLIQLFNQYALPVLHRKGWFIEEGNRNGERIFFPPQVNRKNGKLRVDYFDSVRQVLYYIDHSPELMNECFPPEVHQQVLHYFGQREATEPDHVPINAQAPPASSEQGLKRPYPGDPNEPKRTRMGDPNAPRGPPDAYPRDDYRGMRRGHERDGSYYITEARPSTSRLPAVGRHDYPGGYPPNRPGGPVYPPHDAGYRDQARYPPVAEGHPAYGGRPPYQPEPMDEATQRRLTASLEALTPRSREEVMAYAEAHRISPLDVLLMHEREQGRLAQERPPETSEAARGRTDSAPHSAMARQPVSPRQYPNSTDSMRHDPQRFDGRGYAMPGRPMPGRPMPGQGGPYPSSRPMENEQWRGERPPYGYDERYRGYDPREHPGARMHPGMYPPQHYEQGPPGGPRGYPDRPPPYEQQGQQQYQPPPSSREGYC